MGSRRDDVVQVRDDVLLEVDGRMLRHGVQARGGVPLQLPDRAADRPDQDALDRRFAHFLG